MLRVIGLIGKMGSGKSTVANLLAAKLPNSVILPFAKPLKDVALSMGWNGMKDDKGRRLLQLLGTECGRQCIDENVWVDKWRKTIENSWMADKNENMTVISDDCRFDNEAEVILRFEYSWLIQIIGNHTATMNPTHESENGLDISKYVFHTLDNTKSLDKLIDNTNELAERIFRL